MQERLQSKMAAHTLPSWHCTDSAVVNLHTATTVVACLPDFAAYINDDGQCVTAALVLLDIMLTGSAPKGKFERLASGSHFRTVQNCTGQTAKL